MKQDYLSYKKQKLNTEIQEVQQLKKNDREPKQYPTMFAVFVACLMLFVVFVAKYGSKVDIEYGKMTDSPYETTQNQENENLISKEDINSGIDSRLKNLQDANRAGRSTVSKTSEFEKNIKSNEHEKLANKEVDSVEKAEETEESVQQLPTIEEHRIAYSKVLVGHYSSYDEAKKAQAQLKSATGTVAFVRKMGNSYALQVGSYLDPEQAKITAAKYSDMNYFVLITED